MENKGGKPTYAGRIGNGGAQVVKAPFQRPNDKPKSTVIRGNDLRTGNGKKSK